MPRDGRFINSNQDETLQVTNCSFTLDDVHAWYQKSVHVQGVSESVFRDCSFCEGAAGVGFVGIGTAKVVNCLFVGQSTFSVGCTNGTDIFFSKCLFTDVNKAFYIYGDATNVTMRNTRIFDVEDASIKFDSIGSLSVQDCILDKGSNWTIYQSWPCTKSGDLPHLDMTNNDWGTTCADSIEAWIEVCDYIVDYAPSSGNRSLPRMLSGRREGHVQRGAVAVSHDVGRQGDFEFYGGLVVQNPERLAHGRIWGRLGQAARTSFRARQYSQQLVSAQRIYAIIHSLYDIYPSDWSRPCEWCMSRH